MPRCTDQDDASIADNRRNTNEIAIFLFYDIATGVQASLAFHKDFKHCNVIMYDGESFILHEYDSEGIKTRIVKVKNINAMLRNLRCIKSLRATVVVQISKRKSSMWFPWWVRSCNEFSRYVSGIDTGFSFNPVHFYKKLIQYNELRNYEILHAWRR